MILAFVLGLGCASNGPSPEVVQAVEPANQEKPSAVTEPMEEADLPPSEVKSVPLKQWGFPELSAPESVLYDFKSDRIWVSNIIGSPTDKDGSGSILELTVDGTVKSADFTSGVTLNAPKGMCILDDALYIADIDLVHVVSVHTGAHRYDVPINGAVFLNDMACSHNEAYVSDSSTGQVYRIYKEGKAELMADLSPVKSNGLAFQGMGLYVADFGGDVVLRLSPSGEIEKQWSLPQGGLDGIAVLRDRSIVVSSWEAQGVYRIFDDNISLIGTDIASPADFAVDIRRNRLLIPQLTENQIRIVDLNWPSMKPR